MPSFLRAIASAVLPRELEERADRVELPAGPNGYDPFGAHKDGAAFGLALTKPLYERYFRVRSRGHEHVPADGPVIIAANHSGTLPFDALMLYADLLRHTDPPRLPRAVADQFVPSLPWVNVVFARAGAFGGARRNFEHLLEAGSLVIVFPEGTPGIGKPFSKRYRLEDWREGHVELSIQYRAPIVPAAVVGAEEQMPALGRITRFHPFGTPYIPIPLTPFPLPVRYHIRYGPALHLYEGLDASAADDPEIAISGAAKVKSAVQGLIDQLRAERKGVFR
jgi:1-acyl-sn-glycerol-3-phosphate acyltransferase